MSHLEIKSAVTVDEAGVSHGLAWPFDGTADRVGDMIEKGAFAGVKLPVPMLAFHKPDEPVGVWEEVAETDRGLEVKGRLLVEHVERAREVRALVQAGAVSGLSIGFSTRKAAPRPGRGRLIQALDLVEISLVTVPCHPRARVTSAKSAEWERRLAHADRIAAAINRAVEALRS